MFRRTRKVLKGLGKAIKIATVTATIAKLGLWVYGKTKEQKPKAKLKTTKPKKKAKVK